MELKKITRLSMLLALSIVLNLIESFIPFFNGYIPGLKLGLANSITLLVLYIYSFKDALSMSVLRVFLVGILRTGLFSITFFFSLGGGLLSIIMMFFIKKITNLSIIGISIVGSLFHSIGQIIMAILLLNNINMVYYLPWLLIFSVPTGIITGLVSKELIKYFKQTEDKIN
ncbi:MAG: Gx transporter family protein [Bacilli bacterium]